MNTYDKRAIQHAEYLVGADIAAINALDLGYEWEKQLAVQAADYNAGAGVLMMMVSGTWVQVASITTITRGDIAGIITNIPKYDDAFPYDLILAVKSKNAATGEYVVESETVIDKDTDIDATGTASFTLSDQWCNHQKLFEVYEDRDGSGALNSGDRLIGNQYVTAPKGGLAGVLIECTR